MDTNALLLGLWLLSIIGLQWAADAGERKELDSVQRHASQWRDGR